MIAESLAMVGNAIVIDVHLLYCDWPSSRLEVSLRIVPRLGGHQHLKNPYGG